MGFGLVSGGVGSLLAVGFRCRMLRPPVAGRRPRDAAEDVAAGSRVGYGCDLPLRGVPQHQCVLVSGGVLVGAVCPHGGSVHCHAE